ncbi:MAG: hypothetical protein V4510_06870 [bacterium]
MSVARVLPFVVLAAFALSWAPPAAAQAHHCPVDDSLLLVFRNPDLQPQQDGFIHAQGQFFVQFQAIGAKAADIKVFGFSFGPYTYDFDQQMCGTPVWVTGTYVPNYRADREPSDGFFIPIKTPLVPDGTYAAAVHAYDANNNELARFWAKAVVDNCDTQTTPAQEKCDGDPAQMLKHDKTAPWPIVLPGDGTALSGHKLTIEFGEPLASHTVLLNGKDITAQLKDWEGRLWDADYEPDYGPYGVGGVVAPPCSGAPGQACERYGPAYEWTDRDLTAADVIRVEATDLAGNRAVKDIHIGSSVAGGAITDSQPILVETVDRVLKTAAPGGTATFSFNITNSGGGTGHPFAEATDPVAWNCPKDNPCHAWDPNHVPVPPGTTLPQKLVVSVPKTATPGDYVVNATLTYAAGGKDNVLAEHLTVQVVQGSGPVAQTSTTDNPKPSPMPLAFMAIAAAVLAAKRRA